MGQKVAFPCYADSPAPKPGQLSSTAASLPLTPVSSLERLMRDPKTLSVITEEEWADPEPMSARPVRERRGRRMQLKALLVRKRLKLGDRSSPSTRNSLG